MQNHLHSAELPRNGPQRSGRVTQAAPPLTERWASSYFKSDELCYFNPLLKYVICMLIADLFPVPFGRPTNGLHLLPRLQQAGRAVLVLLGTALGSSTSTPSTALQKPSRRAHRAPHCTWQFLQVSQVALSSAIHHKARSQAAFYPLTFGVELLSSLALF